MDGIMDYQELDKKLDTLTSTYNAGTRANAKKDIHQMVTRLKVNIGHIEVLQAEIRRLAEETALARVRIQELEAQMRAQPPTAPGWSVPGAGHHYIAPNTMGPVYPPGVRSAVLYNESDEAEFFEEGN